MNQVYINVSGTMYIENFRTWSKGVNSLEKGNDFVWREESQAIRTSLPSSLGTCHVPERDGALCSGLWSEPRNSETGWTRVGWALSHPLYLHRSVLPAWGASPCRNRVGGAGVGKIPWWAAWISGCCLRSRGKEPLVSRFRSDYSSLAALSPLARGLCRVGTRWYPTLSQDLPGNPVPWLQSALD